MSRRVVRRSPAEEQASWRELLVVLEAAASLQAETNAALAACVDLDSSQGGSLARQVSRLTTGYAYLIARVRELPSSMLTDEVAGLLRYHHMLLAETSRYAYNAPDSMAALSGRFSDRLGGPAVRLRELRNLIAGYVASAAAAGSEPTGPVSLPGGLSHSFLTPLTTILGNASSLLQPDVEWDRESQRHLLSGIVSESARLARVVENVLSLALMTDGSLQPDFDWCNLESILRAAIAHVEPGLGLMARMDVVIDSPEESTLWADHDLLTRALTDLLDNAARHTPRTSRIAVTATTAGDGLVVSIDDQGAGLPGNVRDAVVAASARGSLPTGVGTGIATAMGAIVLHGGSLTYPSTPSGTRCRIRLNQR